MMPEFELNKLVRDKLPADYERLNQAVKYKDLTPDEHKIELVNKIIEEAKEIKINGNLDDIKSEIADVLQALDDLMKLYNISADEVVKMQQKKHDIKGGFENGVYAETIKLNERDEWVDYYRANPDIFPEL